MTTSKESASPATSSAPKTPSDTTTAALPKGTKATKPCGLDGAALRHLRGLGHGLAPVVMVGKEGVTESVLGALRAALLTHELVKVKVLGEAPLDRHDAAAQLAAGTEAALAQVLGRTLLLYKRHPKKPKIDLPGKAVHTPGDAKARRTKRKARLRAKRDTAKAPARNDRRAPPNRRPARSTSDE